MPEYLAPGVFVEETSFRSKSIEGVGTSVVALVGPTRTGPLRGVPEVLTSYAEYERIFGDAADLEIGAGGSAVLNYSAHAARAFFDNGGKQLFVARVVAGVNGIGPDERGKWPNASSKADADSKVQFFSRFPGRMGNYTLEVHWRDRENLLRSETKKASVTQGTEPFLLDAKGVLANAKAGGAIAEDVFPIDVKAIVKIDGANLTIQDNHAKITSMHDRANPKQIGAGELSGLVLAHLPADATLTRVFARQPSAGKLEGDTPAELQLSRNTDLTAFTGQASWGDLRVLRGKLDAAGETFTVAGDKDLNPGVENPITLKLLALAAEPGAARSLIVLRGFDIDVHNGDKDAEVIQTYAGISTSREGPSSLGAVMPATPERRAEQLTSRVACVLGDNADEDIRATLILLCEGDALRPKADSLDEPRYLIKLEGGADGEGPVATDYAGESDENKGNTGLKALEDIEDVSIVMTPAAAKAEEDVHLAVVLEVEKHCVRMRYRVGIVDSRPGQIVGEVRAFAGNLDDSRLALYYPWVVIADPTGVRREITVPPAGFIAGIYARTDVDRGVHKAPANEIVMGALRFDQQINTFQQELLNPNGINCLRSFAGRGHRVWGGRTLSSDPEWKYVNVRRYFLYLERSIDKSTQWAVFEPNGEALWANIRSSVEDFLFNEWRNRRLLGLTPKEAYFVRCDRSTMTQNDIDNGRMVCLVGVAALTPAEFVIFRIGQKTADA
jgi:phage tail sheath protein FI